VAYTSIASVLNAKFLQRLSGGEVQSTGGSNSKQIQTEARQAVSATLSGVSSGVRVFSNAISSLNSLVSFVNITRNDLIKLRSITDDMIEVVSKATKGGIGQAVRSGLNTDLETLTTQFTRLLAEASNRDYDGIEKEDFIAVFEKLGFDKTKSKTFAALLEKFSFKSNSDGKEVQATDTSEAKRPVQVPQYAYQTTIRTTYNNGDGTFYAAASMSVGAGAINYLDTKSADFNGDGKTDLAFLSSTGFVTTMLGNGDGSYKAAVTYQFVSSTDSIGTLATADMDSDGYSDLVSVSTNGTTATVNIMRSNSDGTFKAVQKTNYAGAATSNSKNFVVGSYDAGSVRDVLFASGNQMYVAPGNNDGTTAAATSPTFGGTISKVVGVNYDNNATTDLVQVTSNGLEVYQNDGLANFINTQTQAESLSTSSNLLAADLNGDGYQDVLVNDATSGSIKIWMNASGTYSASTSIASLSGVNTLLSSDINNDGNADIVAISSTDKRILTYFGNGNGTFQASTSTAMLVETQGAVLLDANGDGLDELATANNATSSQDNIGIFNSTATIVESTGRLGSAKNYATLFDANRSIKSRPDAFKMLADLKAMKSQLDENLNALDDAFRFVVDNMEMLRGVGLAFIDAAKELTAKKANDPDAIANIVRGKIRDSGLKVSQQIGNLDALSSLALGRIGSA
jgi:hypothetical protein